MFHFSSNLFLPIFLASLLFLIGLYGFLVRKNILFLLMSLELMLNAVNLNLLAFWRIYDWKEAPLFVFFIMTLAAAAAGVGLALAVRVFRVFKSVNVSALRGVKE